MELIVVSGLEHPEQIVDLFTEYTKMLVEVEPSFAGYLKQQNYQHEIEDLPDKYGSPDGVLHLILADGKPAGCIGLRKLDETRCEMKRLYVRLVFRGIGIGDMLVDTLIADAKRHGYKAMLLDTFTFLNRAIEMYRKRGFYEIEKYLETPMDDITLYMQLDL